MKCMEDIMEDRKEITYRVQMCQYISKHSRYLYWQLQITVIFSGVSNISSPTDIICPINLTCLSNCVSLFFVYYVLVIPLSLLILRYMFIMKKTYPSQVKLENG